MSKDINANLELSDAELEEITFKAERLTNSLMRGLLQAVLMSKSHLPDAIGFFQDQIPEFVEYSESLGPVELPDGPSDRSVLRDEENFETAQKFATYMIEYFRECFFDEIVRYRYGRRSDTDASD